MNKVYLLEHFKLMEEDGDEEDIKNLGIYSSKKKALEEIENYKNYLDLKIIQQIFI